MLKYTQGVCRNANVIFVTLSKVKSLRRKQRTHIMINEYRALRMIGVAQSVNENMLTVQGSLILCTQKVNGIRKIAADGAPFRANLLKVTDDSFNERATARLHKSDI